MAKVGIITFHASHNCGSFMQSYALQTFLNKSGYSNEIINFSNVGQRELYSAKFKNSNLKNIIKNLILLPHRDILQATYSNYNSFIKNNLKLSPKEFHNNTELRSASFPYNSYISGSDQIWNITIADSDDVYFLDFVKNGRKIAYAPSFGAKNIANYTTPHGYNKYKSLLSSYDSLSIRENNGQKWLKEILGKDVPVVLDPTLLLERKDYANLEQSFDSKLQKNKYIFYYSPSYDRKINHLVKKIAKKYHLKVVAWNPKSFYLKGMSCSGFYLPKVQNPGVYLSLIKNSAMVITTSFHGTIFSTIYRKKFWTIKNGGMFGDDDRVKTLVNQLRISERLIPIQFDDTFDYLQLPDYSNYNQELPKLREKSIDFLLGALKNGD